MNLEEKILNDKIELIINSIKKKGGTEIVSMKLKSIENTPCDFFIICNGNSNRQIQAIAKGIEEKTLEKLMELKHTLLLQKILEMLIFLMRVH